MTWPRHGTKIQAAWLPAWCSLLWPSYAASSSCPSTWYSKASILPFRSQTHHSALRQLCKDFPEPHFSHLVIFKKSWLDGKSQWLLQLLLKQPGTKCARALGQMCILLKLAAGHSTDQWEIITVRLKCSEMWWHPPSVKVYIVLTFCLSFCWCTSFILNYTGLHL